MSLGDLLWIAVGLSMDAFAVSMCKGLATPRLQPSHVLICGGYFGGFQALMPLLGWLLGQQFETLIARVSHWVAFALLAVIGANMIRESFDEEGCGDARFGPSAMLPLAVATAIDALAVGVSLSAMQTPILPAAALFGVVTFGLSGVGVVVGHHFGVRYQALAGRLGGVVLILIGGKILLEGLGILP